jgi:hemoglobin
VSLYQRIGGEAAIQAAVVRFYEKVMADPSLAPFFKGLDMDAQIKKQIAFMTMAFGGPHTYTGASLRSAHSRLVATGLGDRHYDTIVRYLATTLTDLGVEPEATGEIVAIVESQRREVLSR